MKSKAFQAAREAFNEVRRRQILEALLAENGNRTRAAKRLGYAHPEDLFRAIRTLKLRVPKGTPGRPRAPKGTS